MMARRGQRARPPVRYSQPPSPGLGIPILVFSFLLIVLFAGCCGIRSCVRWWGTRGEGAAESEPAAESQTIESSYIETPEPQALVPDAAQFGLSPSIAFARAVLYVPGSGEPAAGRGTCVRQDQDVTLALLLQCNKPGAVGEFIYYSEVPSAKWGDNTIPREKLARWDEKAYGPLNIRWYKIEPEKESYTNLPNREFQWAEIKYVEHRVPEWDNQWSVKPDVAPIQLPERIGGCGTMRYRVRVFQCAADGQPQEDIRTIGLDQARSQGIDGSVTRLSIRLDDTYAGWLHAWANVPYLYGSEILGGHAGSNGWHQAEQFIGSDCADTCVAAIRALGKDVGYTYTARLPEFAKTVVPRATREPGGEFTVDGQKVVWGQGGVQRGDMVRLLRTNEDPAAGKDHVVVLLEDQGTPGVLDTMDIVFSHLNATPQYVTLGEAWQANVAIVLRWDVGG